MIKITAIQKEELLKQARYELARRDFWEFCKLMDPKFFKESRKYLKRIARKLQEFYYSDKKRLLINAPPRFGKSYTIQMFCLWIYGKNPREKIMTASYNELLAMSFSKFVRDKIQEEKFDPDILVYSDIFPETKVKKGDSAAKKWALDCQYASNLATSPTGTATGFGASLIIIDDLIKNNYEANNAQTLENHWAWYTTTMAQRLEKGGKTIVIATRWSSDDLSGRILLEDEEVEVVTEKACVDEKTHEMLCDEILTWEAYQDLLRFAADKNIIYANYQQICMDTANKVYNENFKTYKSEEIKDIWEIYSYTDTADEGTDFLCSIIWGINRKDRKVYIFDIYYTQEAMEITEVETAKRLDENNVLRAVIESNNGGRGFGRAVARNLTESFKNFKTNIECFTQTQNKLTRIITNASFCMEYIYFPEKWHILWPEFWRDINRIQRTGAHLHDDCADALTGVAEIAVKLFY